MAKDAKYGDIQVSHGTIDEDEPVVLFRAQDAHLPVLLRIYESICMAHGSPWEHTESVDAARRKVEDWQAAHGDRVKLPD